jgi:hypothetical protein
MALPVPNPEEKLRYYRDAATKAEQSADRATDPDVHMAYLAIARTWIYLAEELEREMALEGDSSLLEHSDEDFVPPSTDSPAHKSR